MPTFSQRGTEVTKSQGLPPTQLTSRPGNSSNTSDSVGTVLLPKAKRRGLLHVFGVFRCRNASNRVSSKAEYCGTSTAEKTSYTLVDNCTRKSMHCGVCLKVSVWAPGRTLPGYDKNKYAPPHAWRWIWVTLFMLEFEAALSQSMPSDRRMRLWA